MKKDTSVFLSSTFEDLEQHRRKIIDSLSKLKQTVQVMEFWAPSASDSLELSLKKLRKSKIYIGVLGVRYGTISKDGKSITQLEYEEAVRLGIERQVYLIDENKHPVTLKYVDTDESANKLAEFKKLVSANSVRGKFSSSDDLAKQVITNLIDILQEEGEDIRAALNEHGISNFQLKSGYSVALSEEHMDISSLITMNDKGVFEFNDPYIESVTAAAVIARNIKDGNLEFVSSLITFDPDVYKIACYLIKDLGVDEMALANSIKACEDATTLRLLINIAGQAGADKCAESICDKVVMVNKKRTQN